MKILSFLKNIAGFTVGYAFYKMNKVTPTYAYASMRKLYCQTNGSFNEIIAKAETAFRKKIKFDGAKGILGDLKKEDITAISNSIKEKGYHIFPTLLSEDIVKKMIAFANNTPAVPRIADNHEAVIYNSTQPVSAIYDFTAQSLFEDPTIQILLKDESLIAVAQEYLGSGPVLDLVTMWWSTANFKKQDLSKAAQLYHFDMDRIKFLKFFVYLSDVDTNNGPHCYIENSHKIKPKPVRKDGRIMDDELRAEYPEKDFKEITGRTGTILAVDTSGFHKGKPLINGERLLFQMEFATSFFGQNYDRIKLDPEKKKEFISGVQAYADTYAEILA